MLTGGVNRLRAALALAVCLWAGICAAGTVVTFNTSFGDVTVELYDAAAPVTCRNFLNYAYSERYDESMFHRSADLTDPGGGYISEFILQGGGFAHNGTKWDAIVTDPPIVNEFNISNTRGTVAMAKLGGDPNSATSQFFFNLVDNSANLDVQNGGFTVFGLVTGGMNIIDYIAALPTHDLTGYFAGEPWAGAMGEVPLYDDGVNLYFIQTDVSAPAPQAGDANIDDAVDVLDLAALANHYGLPGDMSWMDGDFNDDDTVNVNDLAILANNYGWRKSAGAAGLTVGGRPVPEPAALLLLGLAAPFVLRLYRRRWRRIR